MTPADQIAALEADNAQLRDYVQAVVNWAASAYQWEGFWEDMQWPQGTAFECNAAKLREFLREGRELILTDGE